MYTNTAAVRTSRLSKSYGQGQARAEVLDGIDIEFERGRFTALMGPTGTGKSTLLHCLAGLEKPTSGHVWVGETQLTGLGEVELGLMRRERIGFLFQNHNLLPALTVAENIMLPSDLSGRVLDNDHVERVVDTMSLRKLLLHRPQELTGRQRQRVAAARAFIGRPEAVLADEPTATLDECSTAELLGLLRRGVGELGGSVIMATHDPEVASAADRVLFLESGRIANELREPIPPAELRRLSASARKRREAEFI